MSTPADALQRRDEQAFLDSLQASLAEQLEAGRKEVSIDLSGVLQMPESFMQPLRTAVDVTDGLGATLVYSCQPAIAPLLEAAGLPYDLADDHSDDNLPLVETSMSEFDLDDDWLVAREPNESALIADFQYWFENLAATNDMVQVDLRPQRFVSPRFARAIAECAQRANADGKGVKIRVTSAQELALAQIDGTQRTIQIDREPQVRRPTEVMRTIDRATQAVNEAFKSASAGAGAGGAGGAAASHGRERRVDMRLSIRNAYVIYQVGDDERRRTKLVDISSGGLGFFSSTPIDLERMLKLNLQLPAFLSPERVVGKVASCALVQLEDGSEAYRIGIAYASPLSERLEARIDLLQKTGGD